MNKQAQFNLWYFLLALLAVMWLHDLWVAGQQVEHITYSEFQQALKNGEIESVEIFSNTVRGTFRQPRAGGQQQFVAVRVDPELARELEQYDVKYGAVVETTWLRDLLSWVIPALVFFSVWMFAMRRFAERMGGGGGFLSIGKSKAKVYVETDTGVTFDDVAGVDEAKEELKEVVNFLKWPKDYGRLGARVPKGVLLVGPPGTGKTLLARAVAGEAGVPFFSINGSEFVEMFVGVGAARVRDLFEQARQRAPAIIFIDELDALGRARGLAPWGGHDEREQTLNQLLSEMDGFDPSVGLILLAATNRPEILDPALLRAGRFDRQVLVDRPDKTGRVQILNVHLKKVRLAEDVDPEKIAALTPGFSGADPVHKISIIPRGIGALGYTIQRPTEDRFLMTREELENKMAVLLGGRASEQIVFGHLSTGAADDLAKVTDIARSMVMRYGMYEKLGHVTYEAERPSFLGGAAQIPEMRREFSEETAREIDCAVREIVSRAFEKATAILERRRDWLERGAKLLLEKETLVEEDLAAFRASSSVAA
ncbi:MAG TPA: ATP-dependent metallopeptidase FtsH/Yme1/Tma family protein [Methylococcus sp.]|nr:ATP-dependent metallopeptidase FtsH/Yme1/Tma family protein [Methylococcus sp.]